MMETILSVKDLCKDNILKNISFEVKKGEMVAVMGPSGSGKSTLLYQVSGMDHATSGEIWLGDRELCVLPENKKAALRLNYMGFVFQQMNMIKNLSIRNNILFPAFEAGKNKAEKKAAEARADELMEKMGIKELADRRITEVSGGQLQRACICRSMMNSPKILFADEPTGALNQRAAGEVMRELGKLNRAGTTILLVTHDSKVAEQCERIIYILDGEIKGELELGKKRDSLDENTEAAFGAQRNGNQNQLDIDRERQEKTERWLKSLGW